MNQQKSQINTEQNLQTFNKINFWIQHTVIHLLETIQDFIVILLCLGLFGVMLIKIRELFVSLVPPLNFQIVTSDILFVLILVEIFRLLIIYLQERQVSVAVAVEVAIVSVLREVILRGVLEIPDSQVEAICKILLVLGIILLIPAVEIIISHIISSRFRKAVAKSESSLLFKNRLFNNLQDTKLNQKLTSSR